MLGGAALKQATVRALFGFSVSGYYRCVYCVVACVFSLSQFRNELCITKGIIVMTNLFVN